MPSKVQIVFFTNVSEYASKLYEEFRRNGYAISVIENTRTIVNYFVALEKYGNDIQLIVILPNPFNHSRDDVIDMIEVIDSYLLGDVVCKVILPFPNPMAAEQYIEAGASEVIDKTAVDWVTSFMQWVDECGIDVSN